MLQDSTINLIGGFISSIFSPPPEDGLERCSSCYLPTSWMAVPLIARREYNHNSTVYTFGLPGSQALDLPVCACVLLKAPGRGRVKDGGPEDFDPAQDAVRPYTPCTDLPGKFEIIVKRYDSGAASQYLHGLSIGAQVEFKHIPFNIKTQVTGAHGRMQPAAHLAPSPLLSSSHVSRCSSHVSSPLLRLLAC